MIEENKNFVHLAVNNYYREDGKGRSHPEASPASEVMQQPSENTTNSNCRTGFSEELVHATGEGVTAGPEGH